MKYKAIMPAIALIFSTPVVSSEISEYQIAQWLSRSEGKVIIQNITKIQMENGEEAYLSEAEFPDRSRNFWAGYVLSRPSQKRAIVLKDYGGQYNKVSVLRNNGTSVLVIGGAGSGQGYVGQSFDIVTFNGWGVRKYHSIETSNNLGACGFGESYSPNEMCESTEAFLNGLETTNSNTVFVAETVVTSSGRSPENLTRKINSRILTINIR